MGADTGNAPEPVRGRPDLGRRPGEPRRPAVQRQFRKAQVVPGTEVDGEPLGRGVVVVLGESFKSLRDREVESVTADVEATFCSPPGS